MDVRQPMHERPVTSRSRPASSTTSAISSSPRTDFDEALDTLLQAESLLLGTSDLGELGTTYNSIGRVYRAHGRFDEALRFQLKALSLHEKGGSAFEQMQSLNAVATVYRAAQRFEKRRELLRPRAGHRRKVQLAAHPGSHQSQSREPAH